ncbi:hypothetical protein [Novosphingobium colocasiae]|uniref:DUF4261 domain-containing protein n=1 Tax=Novosphingobium colocasiae TaxID=1256513 RepID=A0A918PIK8_9SPHN|nr:hypothetical protein [Novosphingobium colocasiae]GGZ10392.1 hypothetical protein GCM10011614_26610 [Novosphingobium colocasiae]
MGTEQHSDIPEAGLSLLFAAGERPDAAQMAGVLAQAGDAGMGAAITHVSPPSEGWAEILVSGLAFDLSGLQPAPAAPARPFDHAYGFAADVPDGLREAVLLVPSGHISAGAALAPVVRAMVGLAANLVLNLPVVAVQWHPARTVIEPRTFVRIIMNWLSGGAFPALGLTALTRAEDGSVASSGLAYFTGQEVRIEGRSDEAPADAIKQAIRVVDFLARIGPLDRPCPVEGMPGLIAEPSQYGKLVWVWRKA